MKVFFNCTQHNLTESQQQEIKKKYIDNIDDIKNYPIFDEVRNSADNVEELIAQAYQLIKFIKDYIKENKISELYLHLPIGSPVFLTIFSKKLFDLMKELSSNCKIIPLFSHTERKTIEKEVDGKVIKQNIFEFKKFIELENI